MAASPWWSLKTFYILPTPTPTASPTPTRTRTPTVTPTPDCAQMSIGQWISDTSGGLPRLRINVVNSTGQDTLLNSINFNWNYYRTINSTQKIKQWTFGAGGKYSIDTTAKCCTSPYTWIISELPNNLLAVNGTTQWSLIFATADANWANVDPAMFGLTLGFSNNCTLTYVPVPTSTPTPTRTRTPTRTNTPTITFARAHPPLRARRPSAARPPRR